MPQWTPPIQVEMGNYFTNLNDRSRWGADDEQGALNVMPLAGAQ